MNTEYKATCTAGHPSYGAPAGCPHCDRAVILETKEHGHALAYLEDETPTASDEQRPHRWAVYP